MFNANQIYTLTATTTSTTTTTTIAATRTATTHDSHLSKGFETICFSKRT